MAAARELRYGNRSAVYGDLAYSLDLEVREHALRHAGEAPRHPAAETPAPKAKPRVRSITKAEARQRLEALYAGQDIFERRLMRSFPWKPGSTALHHTLTQPTPLSSPRMRTGCSM